MPTLNTIILLADLPQASSSATVPKCVGTGWTGFAQLKSLQEDAGEVTMTSGQAKSVKVWSTDAFSSSWLGGSSVDHPINLP